MSILQDLLSLSAQQTTQEPVVESHDEVDPHVVEELEEAYEELTKLMDQVRGLVRHLPRHYRGTAEAYWVPHIMIALGGDHQWMTAGHEVTMRKMLDELAEEAGHSNDDEEHDGDDTFDNR